MKQIYVCKNTDGGFGSSSCSSNIDEWDEFKTYDWESIYSNMYKLAFVFNERNVLDVDKLTAIGFQIKGIGKG